MASLYKITKQYMKGREMPVQADINELADLAAARQHVEKLRHDDAALKIKVTYRIYEGMDIVETIEPKDENQAPAGGESSGGIGGSGQSFNPNPFQTSPRPAGMPQGYIQDKKEDDKGDKK